MQDKNALKELQSIKTMIWQLRQDNSSDWKVSILNQYPEIRPVLKLIYNPYLRFNLTGDNVLGYIDSNPNTFSELKCSSFFDVSSLEDFLKKLIHDPTLSGNISRDFCSEFINKYPNYESVIVSILNKDLKCGISVKTINKAWPGLVPEFNVPLARLYKYGFCNFEEENWFASRKIDGVRCLAFLENHGGITMYSRNGNEFFTLNKIKKELKLNWKGCYSVILDGEICSEDSFKETMKGIRRKNYDLEKAKFSIFDMYTILDFKSSNCDCTNFSEKQRYIKEHLNLSENVEVLNQIRIRDIRHFEELVASMPIEWEGLILRKDTPTKFSRSKDILKVKKFQRVILTVSDINIGEKVINNENKACCKSLVAIYKGFPVDIGSGLSDEERVEWCDSPEKIMGKNIEVQFFSELVRDDGSLTLRFASFRKALE